MHSCSHIELKGFVILSSVGVKSCPINSILFIRVPILGLECLGSLHLFFFINPYLKLLITEHEGNFLHKVGVCSIFTILIGWVCCCSKKNTLNSILSIKLDLTNKTFTHTCVIPFFLPFKMSVPL